MLAFCRIGAPQRGARPVQSSQQKVPGRTHTQEFSGNKLATFRSGTSIAAQSAGMFKLWATKRAQRILEPKP